MLVRIAFTGTYMRKRFIRLNVDSKLNLLSKTYLLVSKSHPDALDYPYLLFLLQTLVVFSIVSRASAVMLRNNPTTAGLLAHTSCGAVILAILLVTIYKFERDAFLYLARHDKYD